MKLPQEELLHFIWKSGTLFKTPLTLTNGLPLTIFKPGFLNANAGPDFLFASLKIGETDWHGHVEFHVKSSDWYQHGHQYDQAYHGVILHVVYQHDMEVICNKQLLPVLELSSILPPVMLSRYNLLKKSRKGIPCETVFISPPQSQIENWLNRLWTERLERKTNDVIQELRINNNHWIKTFMVLYAAYLQHSLNAESTKVLIRNLPFDILTKLSGKPEELKDVLLGISGISLKKNFTDSHIKYQSLQLKYRIPEIPPLEWKYARMRPSSFPENRLVELASTWKLFSEITQQLILIKEESALINLLDELPFNEQKNNHLLINVFLPFISAWGSIFHENRLREIAFETAFKMIGEENKIVSYWKRKGIKATTAADSQALAQLNNVYCITGQCMKCHFSRYFLFNEEASIS